MGNSVQILSYSTVRTPVRNFPLIWGDLYVRLLKEITWIVNNLVLPNVTEVPKDQKDSAG